MRDMTHPYVRCDLFLCMTWLVHIHAWHDSFICVTWLNHMCDKTHSYLWQDSFICMTYLIHMCDMTHSYVWHVISPIHIFHACPPPPRIGDMTNAKAGRHDPPHTYGQRNSSTHLLHFHIWVTWLIQNMGDMTPPTHMGDVTRDSYPHTIHDSWLLLLYVWATWLFHASPPPPHVGDMTHAPWHNSAE